MTRFQRFEKHWHNYYLKRWLDKEFFNNFITQPFRDIITDHLNHHQTLKEMNS